MSFNKPYQTIRQENGTLNVYSNNHARDTLDWFQLTNKEQAWFASYRNAEDGAEYVRYRGVVYDLSDTERATGLLAELGWDGQVGDTYFSGVVFKYEAEEWNKNDFTGRVICGTYLC